MNTELWRACAIFLSGVVAAMVHGDARESAARPPDLYRRTALYERFLR